MSFFRECSLFQSSSKLIKAKTLRNYYMEIFNPGWNFNSVYQVEISSRLNRKLLFKMTLQLHVKISIRFANSRWNFNPRWKSQIFQIIDIFSNLKWKFFVYFQKIKMATSWSRFIWTDDKSYKMTIPWKIQKLRLKR